MKKQARPMKKAPKDMDKKMERMEKKMGMDSKAEEKHDPMMSGYHKEKMA